MNSKDIKFFSQDLLKVFCIGAAWYILFFKGISYFFITFTVNSLSEIIGIIAEMIGALTVPLVPTFFLARYLHNNKGKNFLSSWIAGVVIVLVVMTIGNLNEEHLWW